MDAMIISVCFVFNKLLRVVYCFVITTTIGSANIQHLATTESFSNPTPTKRSSKVDHGARRRWPWPLYWWFIRWSDGIVNLYTHVSIVEVRAKQHHRQSSWSIRWQCWWPLHKRLMCPHDGDDSLHTSRSFANAAVLVYNHRRVML